MRAVVSALLCLISCPNFAEAGLEVSDAKGRTMEIELLSYLPKTGMVKFERGDGQIFEVNVDIFDASSQELIVEKAPRPRADITVRVSVGKRNKRQGGSSYMKDQTITATVSLENDSLDIDFKEGKGTLFIIVRQTKRFANREEDYGKVLSKQEFDVTVAAGDERKLEAEPCFTSYDSDRDSTNIGGWAYYGSLFILKDKDGTIHTVDTSIGNLKSDVENDDALAGTLLGLREGDIVEKSLEKR